MTSTPRRIALSRTLSCTLALAPPVDTMPSPTAPVEAAEVGPSADTDSEPSPRAEPTPEPAEAPPTAAPHPIAGPPPPRLPGPPAPPTASTDAARDRCRSNDRDVCRPMTVGGAVLIALGVAGLGGGIGLATISDRTIEGQGGYLRSYRPAGVLLVAAAVLVLTAGAFLVGESAQRQRGERPRRSRRGR